MPTVVRIIGGAGTGKTTDLLNRMEQALTAGGYTPFDVGFCSFTKAACLEAANRAGSRFDQNPDDLAQRGWFRTLHSCCYQLVGASANQLIAGTKKDREWLASAVEAEVSGATDTDGSEVFTGKTDADRILSLWSTARNKLTSLAAVWEPAKYCDERTPDLSECEAIVARYERAKRLDGRIDFVDLLGRYAGTSWNDSRGHFEVYPQGDIPEVPVWFLDEQQDTSPLLDRVCRRLVSASRWVGVCLDPFQAIYGWNGADARCAMAWEIQRQSIMPKTWRCPAPVQELGEKILKGCSDYWDRSIAPADHEGHIENGDFRSASWIEQVCDEIRKPLRGPHRVTHMLLARSNFMASKIAKRLDAMSVPWVPTNGQNSKWNSPARWEAIVALRGAETGGPVAVPEWQRILQFVPVEGNLVRGTKSRFESYDGDPDALVMTDSLAEWGATPEFIQKIKARAWIPMIEGASEVQAAIDTHGFEAVDRPRVSVGTIHSAKGMEADNVYLLTTLSHQVAKGMETQAGADEERRVQYVGVTRAKRRLTILDEDTQFRMEIPRT